MAEGFSEKEILVELMKETKAQSTILTTLKEKAVSIEAQVLKTNGRVTKLEDRATTIETKAENLGVKVAAGVFVASVVVALVINKIGL